MKNKLHIIFIHNSTGSRLYRIIPQAYYMASLGHDIKIRGLKSGETGGIPDGLLQWADIVVVEMVYSPTFINACHKAGAKIVYELDDMMERVPKTHYAYKEMNWWRTFLTYWCLWKSDAITTTTEVIKNRYKWFNDDITVLPNYFDISFWLKPHKPNTSDKIRLLWAGGNSHKLDLQFIAPVIKKILNKYKNVKFVCCGFGGTNSPDKWVQYNYGESLFKDLPQDQYEFSLGAPMEVWPSKLSSLRGDIAIAPVVEEPFAKCKSQCKYGEYSLNKIAGVYSKFLYKSVKDGVTGLVAKENKKEWFDKISYLIENEKQRKIMAQNAYEWTIKHSNFKKHAHKWANVYHRVADK
jgi:glycosyltransferase involved in cell wall biosynthesis|tara:strand:- start:1419 stop:2474 length:1056 start_codon:yes stop_codon:yes gene_type:complete